MSFRSKQPVPPSRHRSSSATRNSGSNGSYSRPRSVGYYGSNPYSNYSTPSMNSYSGYNSLFGGYTSNYKSPYFQNGYRNGSLAGYASLSIPAKAFTNINVITPTYSKLYDNSRDYIKPESSSRKSRELTRGGSFNRDRSLSKSRSSTCGGMGSRSVSLTSLNSEGYISGNDRSNRESRIGSTNDLVLRNENGEIDYKRLYEQAILENDKLKEKLRKSDEELRDTKQTLEKLNTVTSKNSLSELEKRERRAMERKLSEMEEELKQLEILKNENQRLKDENGALIRVISKLSK